MLESIGHVFRMGGEGGRECGNCGSLNMVGNYARHVRRCLGEERMIGEVRGRV